MYQNVVCSSYSLEFWQWEHRAIKQQYYKLAAWYNQGDFCRLYYEQCEKILPKSKAIVMIGQLELIRLWCKLNFSYVNKKRPSLAWIIVKSVPNRLFSSMVVMRLKIPIASLNLFKGITRRSPINCGPTPRKVVVDFFYITSIYKRHAEQTPTIFFATTNAKAWQKRTEGDLLDLLYCKRTYYKY